MEKSPVVEIAKKVCPAVITIVISRDLPKVEGFYFLPFGGENVMMPKIGDGKKEKTKIYNHHSGYIGGIKSVTLEKLRATHPECILQLAIKRMLPRGPLGRKMFKKLWVYAGTEHPHQAQQPKELTLI